MRESQSISVECVRNRNGLVNGQLLDGQPGEGIQHGLQIGLECLLVFHFQGKECIGAGTIFTIEQFVLTVAKQQVLEKTGVK